MGLLLDGQTEPLLFGSKLAFTLNAARRALSVSAAAAAAAITAEVPPTQCQCRSFGMREQCAWRQSRNRRRGEQVEEDKVGKQGIPGGDFGQRMVVD